MFVSSLSANEFVLSNSFRMLGAVFGSVVYHDNSSEDGFPAASQTMKAATRNQNQVIALAIARLQKKAAQLEATGVIGVEIQHRILQKNVWEYTLTGTAIAESGARTDGTPLVCTLTGQEYRLLRAGGFRPVGLAYGVSVYAQKLHQRVQQKVKQRINTERSDFTRGLYTARKYAFAALHQEAAALHAEGVLAIGVTVERALQCRSGVSQGMRIKLIALGTAVTACPSVSLASDGLAEELTITPVVLTSV